MSLGRKAKEGGKGRKERRRSKERRKGRKSRKASPSHSQKDFLPLIEGDLTLPRRRFFSLPKAPSGEKKSAPRGKTSFPFGAWRFPTRELIRSVRSYSSLVET